MADDLTVSSQTVAKTKQMLLDVPQPTVAELQKLLAVQGHILNSLGISLISEAKQYDKFKEKQAYVRLALDCLRESRFALDAAIKAEESKAKSG